MLHKCLAEVNVLGNEFGKSIGPGAVVDLDEQLAEGVRLRDVVDASMFEPIAGPAGPIAQEDVDGGEKDHDPRPFNAPRRERNGRR